MLEIYTVMNVKADGTYSNHCVVKGTGENGRGGEKKITDMYNHKPANNIQIASTDKDDKLLHTPNFLLQFHNLVKLINSTLLCF